jgi:hypothetical protein
VRHAWGISIRGSGASSTFLPDGCLARRPREKPWVAPSRVLQFWLHKLISPVGRLVPTKPEEALVRPQADQGFFSDRAELSWASFPTRLPEAMKANSAWASPAPAPFRVIQALCAMLAQGGFVLEI